MKQPYFPFAVPPLPARPQRPALCGVLLLASVLALAGCGAEGSRKLPGVYRIDIQQGNIIEQEMLDRLQPGMDKDQVRFIMGTPAVEDPFHEDRWDYLFTYSKGGARREQRHVILYFENDKLTHVGGDVVPGERRALEPSRRAEAIDVDPHGERPGFFSRLFNALPFVGDEQGPQREDAPTGQQPEAIPESGDVFEP